MNQFEFLARARRALTMHAFNMNMKIISIEVEHQNIIIAGYVGGAYRVTKFTFGSLEHLEREAFGF